MEVLEEVEEEEVLAMVVVLAEKEVEEECLGLIEEDQEYLGLELEVETLNLHLLEAMNLSWC